MARPIRIPVRLLSYWDPELMMRTYYYGITGNMRKLGFVLILTGLLLPGWLLAGQGSAGAQFLQIFGGTRGAALGGAFSANNGSAQALFWNPAGIRDIENLRLSVTHADYFAGIKYENVAVALPLQFGTIGVFGIGLLSGDIDETSEYEPDGTGSTFTANDYAAGITFSRAMTNKFDGGISFKVINQNLARVSATSWAMDIGALYRTGLFGNLQIGFAIRNFGPDMRYTGEALQGLTTESENPFAEEDVKYELISEEYSLPMSFHLGLQMELPITEKSSLYYHFEAGNSVDQKENITSALEWKYPQLFYVAIGHANLMALFQPDASDTDLGGYMKGLTFGGGINFGIFTGKDFWIEYAWEAHKYLPPVHRIGVEIAY